MSDRVSYREALQQGTNALESIGAQYRLVEDGPGELSGPYLRDAKALRALAEIVERVEEYVDQRKTSAVAILNDLAAGYQPSEPHP